MPPLRSGTRQPQLRSKRVNNVQENPAVLVTTARRKPANRGRGSQAMNQNKNTEGFRNGIGDLVVAGNFGAEAVEKNVKKLALVEEEGSMSPFPERVPELLALFCFII